MKSSIQTAPRRVKAGNRRLSKPARRAYTFVQRQRSENRREETAMPVDVSFEDEFCIVTLNRPDALNALNAEVIAGLGAAIDEAAASGARCLIFTGAGDKAFCAGADIKELQGATPLDHKRLLERGQRTFDRLAGLAIPSIAAINGFAFGGGLELALACTFRLASSNARVGLPEIKLGLTPGYGGTQRLPRVVGETAALEMIMTGRQVTASEALELGLVSHVADQGDVVAAAKAFARTFTGFSLPVLKMVRDAVTRAGELPLDQGQKVEAEIGALAYSTDDAKEGIAAFAEKRPAKFKDA
jgi:enoyl-CoA hydratase